MRLACGYCCFPTNKKRYGKSDVYKTAISLSLRASEIRVYVKSNKVHFKIDKDSKIHNVNNKIVYIVFFLFMTSCALWKENRKYSVHVDKIDTLTVKIPKLIINQKSLLDCLDSVLKYSDLDKCKKCTISRYFGIRIYSPALYTWKLGQGMTTSEFILEVEYSNASDYLGDQIRGDPKQSNFEGIVKYKDKQFVIFATIDSLSTQVKEKLFTVTKDTCLLQYYKFHSKEGPDVGIMSDEADFEFKFSNIGNRPSFKLIKHKKSNID